MSVTFAPDTAAAGRPSVNVSNPNAGELLTLLGFARCEHGGVDLVGVHDAPDFLGRVLLAAALVDITADDELGVPATVDRGAGGLVWTDEGRRPGYLADRLAELVTIAEYAVLHGVEVGWS